MTISLRWTAMRCNAAWILPSVTGTWPRTCRRSSAPVKHGQVARSAAYNTQITSLRLRPWQDPPCVVDEDDPEEHDRQAQMLLRQMLKAGLSRYEPDPRIALLKKNRAYERERT